MHSQFLIVAVLAAYGVAIPLNINLGAYSPALVVGDGEISFGNRADVSSLMSALEGAAVGGAAASNGGARPNTGETTAGETQAAQVASLQGMGKEIAPRVVKMEANKEVLKRDLSGFNAALKFATAALTAGPEVQMATKEAGVGVIVRPQSAIKNGGTGTTRPKKRDAPKMKTTVTTMFVRGGPAPAGSEARSISEDGLTKREPSSVIDGLNLNMADGQVAELTFVETKVADEEEEDEE